MTNRKAAVCGRASIGNESRPEIEYLPHNARYRFRQILCSRRKAVHRRPPLIDEIVQALVVDARRLEMGDDIGALK